MPVLRGIIKIIEEKQNAFPVLLGTNATLLARNFIFLIFFNYQLTLSLLKFLEAQRRVVQANIRCYFKQHVQAVRQDFTALEELKFLLALLVPMCPIPKPVKSVRLENIVLMAKDKPVRLDIIATKVRVFTICKLQTIKYLNIP